MHIELGLFALAISLIGSAIIYAWKGGSLSKSFETSVQQHEKLLEKLQEKADELGEAVSIIRSLDVRVGQLEKNHSLIPKLAGEIEVLKTIAQHSKEMRRVLISRGSRPDPREEE